MSDYKDFAASVKAILDLDGIDKEIEEIGGKKVTFSNLEFNSKELIKSVQDALDGHRFTLNVGTINTKNISDQIGQSGSAAGKALSNSINSSLSRLDINLSNGKFEASLNAVNSKMQGLHNVSATLKGNIDQLNAAFNTMSNSNNSVDSRLEAMRTYQNLIPGVVAQLNQLMQAERNADQRNSITKKINDELASLTPATETFREQLNTILSKLSNADEATLSHLKAEFADLSAEIRKVEVEQQTADKSAKLSNDIESWMNSNTKAAEQFGERLNNLKEQLKDNKNPEMLSQISSEFARIKSEAKAAGLTATSFGASLKNMLTQALGLTSAVAIFRKVTQEIKRACEVVIELDTALVDLKKTSSASASELKSFYFNANDIAKQYGTSTKEIIQSAADWSRLGFNLEDSKLMSQYSSMFASISPNVSVDTATSALVSAMKAFDIEASDVLDGILSKVNIVGNSFAVSNQDIIEGLQRTSAAMSAMGQSLDSTIALFTGANEILQDAASTGTALRSMSLRIRGFDEDTEELSDDLVNLTGKIIDLTKTASKPMGVSIFTDETQTEYKDFVDYFRELSQVWDEMSAKNQTALLNDLFGKRGAQAGSALIKNFDSVAGAIQKMQTSAGNAGAEMEIIYDSLEYKLNALKETGVGITQNLFQTEEMGFVIETLTGVLSLLDSITGSLGLLGTALVGVGIASFIKNFGRLKFKSCTSPRRCLAYYGRDFIMMAINFNSI